MNTTPCNNCVNIGSGYPYIFDLRLNRKPVKTSSSLHVNNKSSIIVASMKGYGRLANSNAVGGPGDQGASKGKVDMKHGGYFRYLMRKRGMAIGSTSDAGKHVGGCGCN
uniref:Uncharacterized protein n=1 Tax=viral metagenome TaxID=1070528 RepID=A0A6C0C5C9_9ZZZZ